MLFKNFALNFLGVLFLKNGNFHDTLSTNPHLQFKADGCHYTLSHFCYVHMALTEFL